MESLGRSLSPGSRHPPVRGLAEREVHADGGPDGVRGENERGNEVHGVHRYLAFKGERVEVVPG